jgi:hypothetical protein
MQILPRQADRFSKDVLHSTDFKAFLTQAFKTNKTINNETF